MFVFNKVVVVIFFLLIRFNVYHFITVKFCSSSYAGDVLDYMNKIH